MLMSCPLLLANRQRWQAHQYRLMGLLSFDPLPRRNPQSHAVNLVVDDGVQQYFQAGNLDISQATSCCEPAG